MKPADPSANTPLAESIEGLLANVPGMIYRCLHDEAWTVQFISEGCLDLTGYHPEEIIQNRLVSFASLIHPDDRPMVRTQVNQAIADRQPYLLHYRLQTRSGHEKWVRERGVGLFDDQGNLKGLQGFVDDVSEQQRALQALRNSEHRARLLFDYAPDAHYLHDLQGRLIDGNRAAETLIGHPRQELRGKSFFDLDILGPGERERAKEVVRRSQAGESTGPQDFVLRRKNGELLRVEISTYPVRIDDQLMVMGIARDVSEQRRAIEALRHSEERFRAVWEQSNEGMRLTDREGQIVAVNEAYCRIVKLPREALVGKPFSVTYFSHGPNDGMDVYVRRFDTGTIVPHFSTTARFWNGEEVGLDISNSFLDMGDGQRLIFTIFRDVTSLRRAEALSTALARLGQKLSVAKGAREASSMILDTAGSILGWDACSVCLYDHPTGKCWSVLSIDTVDGQRWEQPPQNDLEPTSDLMRSVIEHGASLILKTEPDQHTPGSTAFGNCSRPSASVAMVPIRNGEETIGVLSIHRYTVNAYDQAGLETLQALADQCGGAMNRIRAQEALAGSEAELRALFAAMTDVVLVLDRNGQYLQVAPTNSSGLFRPARELLGRTVYEVLPKSDAENVMKSVLQALDHQQLKRIEYTLEINGLPTWFEGHVSPLGPDRVFWISRDITDHKNLEEKVRQSQKMEAIGQLAGGVAHDFNNLLAVIQGNADLALMDAEETTSAETRDCLQQIASAVDRAANLTRQLLVFSRKQGMQPRILQLNDVLGNVAKMLNRIIGEHIELQCEMNPALPMIQADAGMLEQVVVNLVVNARDAMPRGGRLTIQTERVDVTPESARRNAEAREGAFVRLRVQDTGTGIAPEHLRHIFEPFFTTKQVGKGTGLGLATVYGIAKQHQGWVEVQSSPGSGSTFDVFFPRVEARSVAAERSPENAISSGTETILMVEDEASVRTVSRRVLESRGYRILEASSGPEALEVYAKHKDSIQLLLTDMVMPGGISGFELGERLRQLTPSLKVVFMSGYSSELTGKDTSFFRRTRSHFLQKPCTARDLLDTVRQCLDED